MYDFGLDFRLEKLKNDEQEQQEARGEVRVVRMRRDDNKHVLTGEGLTHDMISNAVMPRMTLYFFFIIISFVG